MSKKLVIAEKPSVAMSIASVLGATERKEGYVQGNGYIVSWGIGHLVQLANADSYDEKYTKWRSSDLPIIPSKWKYKIPTEKYKQFETLKWLLLRDDVSEVINACDAGREGELIFRNIYCHAGCKKPISRLWISSMEDSAIEQGFRDLRPGEEYDNLFAAARCREWADWLVGINATRLFSVLYHRTLNVGRVVSPTLAMLVQRAAEIEAFKSEPYYTVELDLDSFCASTEHYANRTEADNAVLAATRTAVVCTVDEKEKTERAPALYDLTTLQRDANRILGYTAQQTLDYAQSLYEQKLCTYPRTDSRYLTDEMEGSVKAIVLCASEICKAESPFAILPDRVCNSKKVTDHHAIIPTLYSGKFDLGKLPTGEREILSLIAMQVLRAVSEEHRYAIRTVEIECGGVKYTAKGKIVHSNGWKVYSKDSKETTIPDVAVGDVLTVSGTEVKEGATKPPAQYTEDSLLSAMESAGAKEMPEDAERKGLGTPATRAGIIEKLVSTGFVERKKGKKNTHLVPASTGVSLITVLPEQLQSPLLTAEWEHKLKLVEKGELSGEVFMSEISIMVNDLVRNYTAIRGAEVLFPTGKPSLGKCPRCGCAVTESVKGFFCESTGCHFGLWKDHRYLTDKRIALTAKMVEKLLSDGGVPVRHIFSPRTGKSYDATLLLTDDGIKPRYALDFGHGMLD